MQANENISVINRNDRSFRVSMETPSYAKFWSLVNDGTWEPKTFRVFDSFIRKDTVFLDVGAWIGPTTLYGSQRAAQTFTFEPDPVAHSELVKNISLNKDAPWASRITVLQKALTVNTGNVQMGCDKGGGGSVSSLLLSDSETSWKVQSTSFEDFLQEYKLFDKPLFIKMDIEGAEYELLPQIRELLKNTDSVLHLSLHPGVLRRRIRRDPAGLLGPVARRAKLVRESSRLFEALPFRYLYQTDGHRLSRPSELFRAILTGKTARDLVATNNTWNAM